jgi:hypothetical protein
LSEDKHVVDNVMALVSLEETDSVLKSWGKKNVTEETYFPYRLK